MGQTVFTASNAAWPTPVDWNNSNNFLEGIAGGGGGQDNNSGNGNGGGGGAYGKAVNQTLSANPATNNITVGAAGAAGTGTNNATAGGATSFKNSGSTTLMSANGGSVSTTTTAAAGGTVGTGSTTFAGGPSAAAGHVGASGGGGAAGPNGVGGTGGLGGGTTTGAGTGGGGGGSGGGSTGGAGTTGSPAVGAAGGNKFAGGGGGSAGTSGGGNAGASSGGGGGGTGGNSAAAGTSSTGSTEDGTTYTPSWGTSTNGSGGGGGGGGVGSSTGVVGAAGGNYGGGGGGGSGSPTPNGAAGAAGIVVVTWTPSAAGIALGQIASDIFVPGRRQGPMRGLRPTQAFPPVITPPFIFQQDSPRWRSTAAAVLLLANLNTSFVPQPPAPPTLGWLQPFATPQQPARPRYDLNQGWVPQAPSAVVAPIASVETDSSQPGPVYQRTALYQVSTTFPASPPAPVVVTPPIGWLAPFAVPPQLLRRYDLNQGWIPQPPAATPTPSTLGWLNPFPTQTARRPVYDLNQGWVPQVPSAPVVTLPPLGWLTSINQPQPPVTIVANTVLAPFTLPEIPVLGWFRPFDQPPPKARPRYDLNSGWVAPVPAAAVVTPPPIGWLQPAAVPPRDTLVFDTIIEPFALPAPVISASAEVDIAQPGPVYTRTFIYQSLFAPPQAVGGVTPVVVLPLENDSPQPGPVYSRTFIYQSTVTPPQNVGGTAPPVPPSLGWLSQFDQFYRQTYLYQSQATWPPVAPPAPAIAPPFGWFTQYTMPPRETVVANTVLSPFALPEIQIWGWYQPLATPPRQRPRLWDWNTAWPAAPPAPVAITPSTLGWLQPFPMPPQPPRRPIFIEFYVPQNVGGTAPPPPTVLQPGGASVPHTFSRKRWRELQALIAAENAAVAKAERLTKESKREPLLKAARAAAAAIDAADKEGESKRLDALLLRNAESLRRAIRAATDVKRIREAANAIELSNAIVARTVEDEEDEMIQLLLLLS